MISYFQFLLLSRRSKKQYLSEKGTFLLNYQDTGKQIDVYAVSDFFVEIHTDAQTQATEIISFKGLHRLEQYARHIQLTQLLSTF
jgi:hypothetical protein